MRGACPEGRPDAASCPLASRQRQAYILDITEEAEMYKKILVPVDLGEDDMTQLALGPAIAQAKAGDAQLRLINVQPIVPVAFIDYIPPTFDDEMRDAIEKELAALCDKIDLPRDRVSSTVRFGAVYPEVLAEADDWNADLIVVGSHRPTMATYLLGSNAKTIVRHAKCSVLVVRK